MVNIVKYKYNDLTCFSCSTFYINGLHSDLRYYCAVRITDWRLTDLQRSPPLSDRAWPAAHLHHETLPFPASPGLSGPRACFSCWSHTTDTLRAMEDWQRHRKQNDLRKPVGRPQACSSFPQMLFWPVKIGKWAAWPWSLDQGSKSLRSLNCLWSSPCFLHEPANSCI